ncbi:MAG: hypothetical protein EBR82_26430 [Caulobacteraceae bacterium]|nr:hypothetical protein [Caulobacteraceae bacterium]
MPETRVLAILWPRVSPSLHTLYLARRLDVSVGAVEWLPRNRAELWPMREVRLLDVAGALVRSALVSLDEHGRPLVAVIPHSRRAPASIART